MSEEAVSEEAVSEEALSQAEQAELARRRDGAAHSAEGERDDRVVSPVADGDEQAIEGACSGVVEPVFAGFKTGDHRMRCGFGVCGGVLARRLVTAPHVSTFLAHAEVNPVAPALGQAVLATRRGRGDVHDLVQMTAGHCHRRRASGNERDVNRAGYAARRQHRYTGHKQRGCRDIDAAAEHQGIGLECELVRVIFGPDAGRCRSCSCKKKCHELLVHAIALLNLVRAQRARARSWGPCVVDY